MTLHKSRTLSGQTRDGLGGLAMSPLMSKRLYSHGTVSRAAVSLPGQDQRTLSISCSKEVARTPGMIFENLRCAFLKFELRNGNHKTTSA